MMRWISLPFVSGALFLSLSSASLVQGRVVSSSARASLSAEDEKTIDLFLKDAKAYLVIEHNAPSEAKLKPTTDIAELGRRRKELRQIIVAARPNAKQGDLFTPPVANLFRKQLALAMDGEDGKAVRRTLQNAEPAAAAQSTQIAVNRDYPNQNGQPLQSVPATVLQCLPILPKGLDYRMVGDILVLRDTEANLVVDYLPNAYK